MSQRKFKTKNYEIISGWDNTPGHFFLSVYQDGKMIFSDLLTEKLGMTVEEIKGKFKEFGIVPPETFWSDLESDKQNRDGSLYHEY